MCEVIKFPKEFASRPVLRACDRSSACRPIANSSASKNLQALEQLAQMLTAYGANAWPQIRYELDVDRLVISRLGHHLGVWVWLDDAYAWIPAAYSLPSVTNKCLDEAAVFTWSLVSRCIDSMSGAVLKA